MACRFACLFRYGRMLLTELPAADTDPMPQLSKSVQLTHLRISVSGEEAIELESTEQPGVALTGSACLPLPSTGNGVSSCYYAAMTT